VASEPGKGSVFTLYFPAIQKQEVREAGIKEEMPTGHEHILLVDDEQVLVEVSRRVLERLGYRVDTRTSSVEALALFKSHPQRYDLVITDMTMPNMTGDKLAMEILQVRADIPIVLCTGYSENILEERAQAIGIKALIRKPILMAEIARAMREALAKE
jgi:CheY-like chemotaxis protein